METIHELSGITPLTELDLFAVPPTQTSIERDVYTEHRPISILNSESAITFVIPTPLDEYMQLREMMFYIKIRIDLRKINGGDITSADWDKVSTVNYLLHSIFKQVEVEINNKTITGGMPTYAYKAYFDAMCHFSDDARKSHLTGALWDPATLSTQDGDAVNKVRNKAIRPTITSKDGQGDVVDLMGKLHIDLSYQERALLGGSQLKITLIPNDPKFYIMNTDPGLEAKVNFMTAALYLHRSKVSSYIVEAHSKALEKATAKYPYSRREVKAFNINAGATSAHIDNIVLGVLPRRVFIGLVENKAFTGDVTKNPFNFKHFNINYLAVNVDGEQIPATAYTPDFVQDHIIREYMGFLEALNQLTAETYVGTGREGWQFTPIFGFNLAPDMSEGVQGSGHVNKIRRGSLRVELRFATALTVTATALVYCEYDSLLEINKNREVSADFL